MSINLVMRLSYASYVAEEMKSSLIALLSSFSLKILGPFFSIASLVCTNLNSTSLTLGVSSLFSGSST